MQHSSRPLAASRVFLAISSALPFLAPASAASAASGPVLNASADWSGQTLSYSKSNDSTSPVSGLSLQVRAAAPGHLALSIADGLTVSATNSGKQGTAIGINFSTKDTEITGDSLRVTATSLSQDLKGKGGTGAGVVKGICLNNAYGSNDAGSQLSVDSASIKAEAVNDAEVDTLEIGSGTFLKASGKSLAVEAASNTFHGTAISSVNISTPMQNSLHYSESIRVISTNQGGNTAYGIRNAGLMSLSSEGSIAITASSDRGGAQALMNTQSGVLSISAPDISIEATGRGASYVARAHRYAAADSKILIGGESSRLTLLGDLVNESQNAAEISVTGKSGSFTGAASSSGSGIIRLSLGDAAWNVTKSSSLSSLSMGEGGLLNLSYAGERASSGYRSLKAESLAADGTTLSMRFDFDRDRDSQAAEDQLILGSASGHLREHIIFSGAVGEQRYSRTWLVSQREGDLIIMPHSERELVYQNGGASAWLLCFVPEGEEDALTDPKKFKELDAYGNGAGTWHLVRLQDEADLEHRTDPDHRDDPEVKPGAPLVTPEAAQQIAMGVSASQAIAFTSELEDLRSRLGEVRSGAEGGAWVRLSTERDKVSGRPAPGFSQKTHAVQAGLDRIISSRGGVRWLAGGAFRYGHSSQSGLGAASAASGTLQQYSGKLYATRIADNGSYADFVAQLGRYSQDLKGVMNDGASLWRAGYYAFGWGLSSELGRKLAFPDAQRAPGLASAWLLEPQIQLSFFQSRGADYTTTSGMQVSQDTASFLSARAGLVAGREWRRSDGSRFQAAFSAGLTHEFLGGQNLTIQGSDGARQTAHAASLKGTGYYWGLMADWQPSARMRLYAQAKHEKSGPLTRAYAFQAGLKILF